jgi:oligopeptidase B
MRKGLLCIWLLVGLPVYSQTIPRPKKIPTVFEEFGNRRVDNYYWMNRRDAEVADYLKQENAYTEAVLEHTKGLQDTLLQEFRKRAVPEPSSLPYKENGYWYYSRMVKDKPYPVYCRKKGSLSAPEQVVQDMNELAEGFPAFFATRPVISGDNSKALICFDSKGDRLFTLLVKDLYRNQFLRDTLTGVSVNESMNSLPVWLKDFSGFYYTFPDALNRPFRLYLHKLGDRQEADPVIFQETDSLSYLFTRLSVDRDFLFLSGNTNSSSEIQFIDLRSEPYDLRMLVPRKAGIFSRIVDHHKNHFYVITNDHAPHNRVLKLSSGQTLEEGEEVIPEQNEVFLQSNAAIVKDKLICKEQVDGVGKLYIKDLRSGAGYFIELNQDPGDLSFSFSDSPKGADSIRLRFSSYAVPPVDYAYDLQTRELRVIRQQTVDNMDPDNYITKVMIIPVRDGTKVPVSMVYRKNMYREDGLHPMLLETYSWNNGIRDPHFEPELISLLDRGFIYVYPCARGGEEKGPESWDSGRRQNRMNAFYDVIDCAQYLIDHLYTSPNRLVAIGVNAGGTSVGVLVNLRPDLFRAVVAETPWLDVITGWKDPHTPSVTEEYREEGDPNNKEEYQYMLKWSPYDNLVPQVYPRILAICNWNNARVPYYHAAKWVARIRDLNQGKEPVLLLTNFSTGQMGASDQLEAMKAAALKYAFVVDAVRK